MPNSQSDKAPAPAARGSEPAQASPRQEIEAFLGKVRALGPAVAAGERGRLIFSLDATMSRQPTWDRACTVQGEMFDVASAQGGLSVQLVYFRGFNECQASKWVSDPEALGRLMR